MSVPEIIDEVYQNYLANFIPPTCPPNLDVQPSYYEPMTKEWFIKSIKERGLRGEEFSEKWGLKIEERDLNTQERNEWFQVHLNGNNPFMKSDWKDYELDQQNIPTKLITLTYNNETIESYDLVI
jgi:hypothetical protein